MENRNNVRYGMIAGYTYSYEIKIKNPEVFYFNGETVRLGSNSEES